MLKNDHKQDNTDLRFQCHKVNVEFHICEQSFMTIMCMTIVKRFFYFLILGK